MVEFPIPKSTYQNEYSQFFNSGFFFLCYELLMRLYAIRMVRAVLITHTLKFDLNESERHTF